MKRLAALTLLLLAPALAASEAPQEAQRERGDRGGYVKTGWMIHAGYFFHDTMFYGSGRGGPHAAVARVFPLFKQVGLWTEAGCMLSSGTLDTVAADDRTYRTSFETRIGYLAVGPSLAYWPIPFGLAVYYHRTELDDLGESGPLAGTRLSGRESGLGLGLVVNILAIFGKPAEEPGFRLRATLGYVGFIDSTRPEVVTASDSGQTVTHRKWKAFRGECLRAGAELDF